MPGIATVPPTGGVQGATTFVTVGNTTTAIAAANASRKYLAIVNDSDEAMYLGIGAAAVMNKGIRLNANGGTFEINLNNRNTSAINGICASGGKNATLCTW